MALDGRQARRQGQRDRGEVQRQPEGLQGRRGLQGPVRRVAHRRHRRLPRRQAAADRAGVRGRHGDHDGGARRGDAGLQAHGRCAREVRPEGLPARRDLVLLRHARQPAVDAVQQLDPGALHQQGRVQEGRPRSREAARDLARAVPGCRQAQGRRRAVRLHHRLAVVGAARELQRLAQRALRDAAERLRRPRDAARVQRPGADDAHPEPGRDGEEGHVHLRRAQGRADRQVPGR